VDSIFKRFPAPFQEYREPCPLSVLSGPSHTFHRRIGSSAWKRRSRPVVTPVVARLASYGYGRLKSSYNPSHDRLQHLRNLSSGCRLDQNCATVNPHVDAICKLAPRIRPQGPGASFASHWWAFHPCRSRFPSESKLLPQVG